MFRNVFSQSVLKRMQSAKLFPASTQRTRWLHSAETVRKAQSVSQLPYNDTVPASRKEEVMDSVYCRVADQYDLAIDVLSLFMNSMWKRRFVTRMQAAPGANLLDVAGGTGEIAKHYLEYQEAQGDLSARVHVVDFNPDMLRVGRRRMQATEYGKRVTFAQGNAEDLKDVGDASVDVYSISAGMHNLANPTRALDEAFRVLRPGGTFACLEYGHVDAPVIGSVCRWYMDRAVPVIGRLVTGDGAPYERLAGSVRGFPHQKQFAQAIRNAGFQQQGKGYEQFQWGMMVSYIATKPYDVKK
ncbi:2-hexaprenyl-6-methoxy-1,4-benzoquinone methyltransferase [Coemansia sp. RSA 2703]|nr:2-hexaprenyl-6-methoxy-1,4-benzoquinone methyltransferase [Coemansia sp. RSA 2703]KAJ2372645.1 2-hexaprenyl-6-methoxy-1,4-benzoquinone methyltransferase [Coemansia sp. RSA 2607]